ncbi:hypothetical protein AUP44_08260 [Tistrella mobilis]|uniref:Uncharacterized protein n=1 Tax=Tistrella mobilis TaxID=171437 RepID=A0A161Q267_9PROT|nr:hypothetical protein AUP44_08260 [Tistrella mobilis]
MRKIWAINPVNKHFEQHDRLLQAIAIQPRRRISLRHPVSNQIFHSDKIDIKPRLKFDPRNMVDRSHAVQETRTNHLYTNIQRVILQSTRPIAWRFKAEFAQDGFEFILAGSNDIKIARNEACSRIEFYSCSTHQDRPRNPLRFQFPRCFCKDQQCVLE